MLEILKEVLSDITNLSAMITSSTTIPLSDKLKAKEIEKAAVEKLLAALSISPFGSQKIVRDYLTAGEVSKITNIALSNVNLATVNLSSLIFDKDKEISSFNFHPELKDKVVQNSFTEMTGKIKYEFTTSSNEYVIVFGADGHYHVSVKKFWYEVTKDED